MSMLDSKEHINPFDPKKYKPKADLWDKIDSELSTISPKPLASTFSTFKPSPDVWNKIEGGLQAGKAGSQSGKLWYFGLVAVFLIGIIYILSTDLLSRKENETIKITETNKHISPLLDDQEPTNINEIKEKKVSTLALDEKQRDNIIEQNNTNSQAISESKIKSSKKEKNRISQHRKVIKTQTTSPITILDQKDKQKGRSALEISKETNNFKNLAKPLTLKSAEFVATKFYPLRIKNRLAKIQGTILHQKPIKIDWSRLFYGVHYSQELFSDSYSYSENRKANSFGVDLGYTFNSVFIQSGLYLQSVEDEAFYEISFLKNEVVGSEMRVDSIVYEYNPDNSEYIRHYITSEKKLYDSLEYKVNKNPVNNYKYIRIPLLIGYKYQYSKFSFSAKVGTEFVALIEGKEPTPTINGEEIRILQTVKKSVDKSPSTWKVLVSVGAQYPVYKSIKLNVEAQYKSSFQSYYDFKKAAYVRPYSIGIKAGFLINF